MFSLIAWDELCDRDSDRKLDPIFWNEFQKPIFFFRFYLISVLFHSDLYRVLYRLILMDTVLQLQRRIGWFLFNFWDFWNWNWAFFSDNNRIFSFLTFYFNYYCNQISLFNFWYFSIHFDRKDCDFYEFSLLNLIFHVLWIVCDRLCELFFSCI